MNGHPYSGVCTALVTPFYNGKVNYPMLEQLLKRQIKAGVKAIVLAGTTGESSTLSDFEKLELFKRGKDNVGDKCSIIAGTGSNATDHAVYLSKCAQGAGVDGLLVVSPYYNKATPAGLIAHYTAIANAVKIPVIGMGGIMSAEDALEFILAGATAVAVGTGNLINPETTVKVVEGIENYMRRYNVQDINELIGAVK